MRNILSSLPPTARPWAALININNINTHGSMNSPQTVKRE